MSVFDCKTPGCRFPRKAHRRGCVHPTVDVVTSLDPESGRLITESVTPVGCAECGIFPGYVCRRHREASGHVETTLAPVERAFEPLVPEDEKPAQEKESDE